MLIIMRNKLKTNTGLRALVVLMSLSFAGVAAIQAYWLQQAYSFKEQQFSGRVNDAMLRVSERVENLEAASLLSESFQLEPFFSSKLNPFMGIRSGDSLNGSDDTLHSSFRLSMNIGDETVIVSSNGKQITTFMDSGNVEGANTDALLRKTRQLDQVLRHVLLREMRRQSGIQNVIEKKSLDSIITHELALVGVTLPYEFAVVDDKEQNELTSEKWDAERPAYQAALFPNDLFTSHQLLLSFPAKSSYLLGSMWITFVFGLFLTLAMIFTFYKTLQYSLKQKRINEIKTDFINNMTHEFKTPIATINLAIDALKNPKVITDTQRVSHYSNLIRQENQRMNMQVESVLRMALMDKQELEFDFTKNKVQPLIDQCIDHIRLSLENKGGTLKKFFNDGDAELNLDVHHFTNAVINILDNALKYSLSIPEIRVTTEKTNSHFILIISDKGMGMTKDEQKHIFDRFYRVTGGNIHDIKGHGLGLSYAKGVVEAHDGRIDVQSEKGKGSKFYIYIPL